MQEQKRCVRCNTLNESGKLYCVRCGKYLSDKGTRIEQRPTIWDFKPEVPELAEDGPELKGLELIRDEGEQKGPGLRKDKQWQKEEHFVICPGCGQRFSVSDGILPLFCEQCGYFFQAGIDRILSENEESPGKSSEVESSNKSPGKKSPSESSGEKKERPYKPSPSRQNHIPQKKNPLPRAKRDASDLRLIPEKREKYAPVCVRKEGEIIGKDGTILKELETSQQIKIWHAASGWYAMTLAGHPLCNGVLKNAGVQVRLRDGDVLTIEREQIHVEIVDPEEGFWGSC